MMTPQEAYHDTPFEEIQQSLELAQEAFKKYSRVPLSKRAEFMKAIARELANDPGALVQTAHEETHLPLPRLESEKARTIFQLESYADACERGDWMQVSIDRGDPGRTPPKPDLRKMKVPLGVVVVFGSSNFPFAYSTAGGDTASALAAGCPVVVKAHPAHPGTSARVADLILKAAESCGMPRGIFTHIFGASVEVGKFLVQHPLVRAVGFTGSLAGGRQLFDWGNQRKDPIPVFAEMGSVNPVFLLPEKLAGATAELASQLAASLTLGVGQFCTNPGLIIGLKGEVLEQFAGVLAEAIKKTVPAAMLHQGIARAYDEKRAAALQQPGVQKIAESAMGADSGKGMPTVATVEGALFLKNPLLHQEVFGPFSLLIQCEHPGEMYAVAESMEGQLTSTIMATQEDIQSHLLLLESLKRKCGRLILNGVPTGVEVCQSMQHGGPYPATTDSRFTSVGPDAISRFARPLAFQGWPDTLLPDALKDANPLKLIRTVDSKVVMPQ